MIRPGTEFMLRALIIDRDAIHADQLAARLRRRNLVSDYVCTPQQAIKRLKGRTEEYVLVIINVSDSSALWFRVLEKLQDICRQLNRDSGPLFLCVSKTQQRPEFILRLECTGARYVYE